MLGKISVTIEGETPLLMNRLSIDTLKKSGRSTMKNYDPEEEARKAAYIDEIDGEEQLYIPMEAVYSMLIYTSGAYKVGRRSAKSYIAGSIRIHPEKIPLGTNQYEIDLRPVVIQKARVVRSRAKVPQWKATFTLVYNQEIIPDPTLLKTIFEDAGTRVGLLDFRPQRSGWFGTFKVTEFEEITS